MISYEEDRKLIYELDNPVKRCPGDSDKLFSHQPVELGSRIAAPLVLEAVLPKLSRTGGQ